MTENNRQKNKTPWIIGTILAILLLVSSLFIMLPLMLASIIGSNEANSLLNNGCYTQTDSDSNPNTADGITGHKLGPSGYSDEQLKNARTIDRVAQELGLSGHASIVAITAAFGESTLYNLNHGDEASVTNPDGTATTSKGLFQQQTSMGWGTVEQVTNPEYATKTFLLGKQHNGTGSGLISVNGWENMDISHAINAVQANSDPNHYARYYTNANEIIDIIGINRNRPADESKQKNWNKNTNNTTKNNNTNAPTTETKQNCNTGLNKGKSKTIAGKEAKNTYPWGEYGNGNTVPGPGIYNPDPMGFFYGECTSFAAWKVNEAMGGTKDNFIFNNSYGGAKKGNGGEWKAAWEANGWEISDKPVPGSVAWWAPYDGEGIGSAGHVAWVTDVTEDGKAIIEEYNNSYYAPPGHKYNVRPQPVDASEVSGFLLVPNP